MYICFVDNVVTYMTYDTLIHTTKQISMFKIDATV